IAITQYPTSGSFWGPAFKIIDSKKQEVFQPHMLDATFFPGDDEDFIVLIKPEHTYKDYEVYEWPYPYKTMKEVLREEILNRTDKEAFYTNSPALSFEWGSGTYVWEYARYYFFNTRKIKQRFWEGELKGQMTIQIE
ncbi:MAG: hypothetical protein V1709_11995, partial [Planctomycetota bacterium]